MNEEQRLVQKRLRVLEHAQKTGNIRKTCRYFGIARSSFYRLKRAFDRDGESGHFFKVCRRVRVDFYLRRIDWSTSLSCQYMRTCTTQNAQAQK